MPKFQTGGNPEGIRSAQWIDSSRAFPYHVVRQAIGTQDAAEYPHAAADLLWGVITDEGTTLNRLTVATEGVVQVRNSLAGTINIGDPIVYDNTNSGGTVGFVKSAYTSEAPADVMEGTQTTPIPGHVPLSNKAIPGSVRAGTAGNLVVLNSGTALGIILAADIAGSGTVFASEPLYYTIDQPIIGYSREKCTTPRSIFKVEMSKQRYIKNNTVN